MVSRSFAAFAFISAVVSIFAPASSTAVAQESLTWKFKTGESLAYVVQQNTLMDMELNGQKQSVSIDQKMDMLWKIASVGSGGDARMAQSVQRVQLDADGGPFGSMKYDSNNESEIDSKVGKAVTDVYRKIVKQDFDVTMQSTGKVQDVVVPKAVLATLATTGANSNGMSEDTLKQMMTQSAVNLPPQPVKTGDSWQSNQKIELDFGTMLLSSELTYMGTENGLAKIDIKPTIDVKAREGAQMTLTMKKSDGKGTVLFDVAKGRIARSDLDLTMEMEVKRFGTQIQQKLRQKTSMVLSE